MDVSTKCPIELSAGYGIQRRVITDSGIGDYCIQTSVPVHDRAVQGVHLLWARDVRAKPTARSTDGADRVVDFGLLEPGEDDECALVRQFLGDAEADAAASTGDHCDSAMQS